MQWLRRLFEPTPPLVAAEGPLVRIPAPLAGRLRSSSAQPLEQIVTAALEQHLARLAPAPGRDRDMPTAAEPPAAAAVPAFWLDRGQDRPSSDIEDVLRNRVQRRRAAEAER